MSAQTTEHDDGWIRVGTARIRIAGDQDGVRTLAVGGEIDVGCAAGIKREVTEAATQDTVVDLGTLEFLDSTGIRLLVELRREAAADGRRLRFRDPQPRVLRLLDMTGLREGLLADG